MCIRDRTEGHCCSHRKRTCPHTGVRGSSSQIHRAAERTPRRADYCRRHWPNPVEGNDQMILRKLHLANFRAFEQIEIEFEPGVNVIAGVNGVGKSSLLRAIATGLS